jgi:succinate dehydrogenase/fumarate reductase flavoprotein subunit
MTQHTNLYATQPEVLRLADALESDDGHTVWQSEQAAGELRRLHEENSKLRREVAAISANAVDDGRAMSKLEAQLGEAVWNYGEVKRINAQLLEALEQAEQVYAHLKMWPMLDVARAAIAAAKLQERS